MDLAFDDTIAAIATAPGEAGLAVVRVSGPRALAIAGAVFRGRQELADAPTHSLHHGWAVGAERDAAATDARRDEVVAAVFRAPRSYTREDVVELSCHGGDLPAEGVLQALLTAGARLARPGEFTLRAFLHGRIDLVQAEAVAELIQARTLGARQVALARLAGDLSVRLRALAEAVADAVAEVEARVDFAEDVGGIEVPDVVIARVRDAGATLAELLAGAAWGRAMREGVSIPIVGRPNAGKSSVFNALVGAERAIVTPVPGTTRDRVSESVEIHGALMTLSDTAGLRSSADEVEAIGVRRTLEALEDSPVALWVVDGSTPLTEEDRAVAGRLAGKQVVVALNKRDLGAAIGTDEVEALLGADATRAAGVSATRREGIGELERLIGEAFGFGGRLPSVNPRQAETLERARAALERAALAGESGAPGEIVALELREALGALEEAIGRRVSDDLLDRIFSRFCVGK